MKARGPLWQIREAEAKALRAREEVAQVRAIYGDMLVRMYELGWRLGQEALVRDTLAAREHRRRHERRDTR